MRTTVLCAVATAAVAFSPNQTVTELRGNDCSTTNDCNFKDGIDYNGYDLTDTCGILLTRLTSSKEECCIACKATEGCEAFTWDYGSDMGCYLKAKNATTNPVPSSGKMAGRIDL